MPGPALVRDRFDCGRPLHASCSNQQAAGVRAAPALPNVLSTACPLSTVEALIDAKQLTAVKTPRSPRCLEIGVDNSLWQSMDMKDRQGLILAVECAVSVDRRIPCLKLYSRTSGALVGSSEMGKVKVAR